MLRSGGLREGGIGSRVRVFGLEVTLGAVAFDELDDVESRHLLLEVPQRGVVVRVAHGVFHQLDDELDDHLVEPAGMEVGDPDHRVADRRVLARVTRDDRLGKLLQDDTEQVRGVELRHLLARRLDRLAEDLDEELREESLGRMDVHHDRVSPTAVTVVFAHAEVERLEPDRFSTGKLQNVLVATGDAWLCHVDPLEAVPVKEREGTRPFSKTVTARDACPRMDVLKVAADAIATGPVCDPCLGRLVADRSFGLSNAERGKALRVARELADDEDHDPVDVDDCWICEGHCGTIDRWADRAAEAVEGIEFATYNVGTRPSPLLEENERLLREEVGLDPDAGEPFKSAFNREVGKRFGSLTDTTVSFDRPDVQFTIDLAEDDLDAKVNSTFVYGRYRKLERDVPQTEWPCRECHGSGRQGREPCDHCGGSGYLYDDSVEGYVAPIVEDVMDGTEAVFHGAGREDVDALMLGTGRPFVVEIEEPRRRRVDVDRLEGDINALADGTVEVEGLRLATYDMVARVKELEASKRYRAAVAFENDVTEEALAEAVESLSGATIEQYTPNRVDHRRASLTREREVYEMAGELEDPRHATVEVHGAGGLYIKELISGDEGRTEPSLAGLLGVDAEVTALDVLAVEGEVEPFEDEAFFRD